MEKIIRKEKSYDFSIIPKKYKRMSFEEKIENFRGLNEQLHLGILNLNEVIELAALSYILLKEDGFF